MAKRESVLDPYLVIIWDFDGVIKDSINIKSDAFESLFKSYGSELVNRVRNHHEANGGVSRFDKIPLYLKWGGESINNQKIDRLCNQFSELVVQAVIDSPWIPCVQDYLHENYKKKYFVVSTATPQGEIEKILESLNLKSCFRDIYGAPLKKKKAIKLSLKRFNCSPNEAVMIGDSESDLLAAKANSVPFILRRTSLNIQMQNTYQGPMIDNFCDE